MQPVFRVGQLVRPKPHTPARTDSRAYCIVGIVPSQDGAPVYLIKNMIGAEQIIKQSEIVVAPNKALP